MDEREVFDDKRKKKTVCIGKKSRKEDKDNYNNV